MTSNGTHSGEQPESEEQAFGQTVHDLLLAKYGHPVLSSYQSIQQLKSADRQSTVTLLFGAWIFIAIILMGLRVGSAQEDLGNSEPSSTKSPPLERQRVGISLGADVYREELPEKPTPQDVLRLFISKPMNNFYQERVADWDMTDEEIQSAVEWETAEAKKKGGRTWARWQQKTAELVQTMPQRRAELLAAINDPASSEQLRIRYRNTLRIVELELTHPHATEVYLLHQNTKYERYLYDTFHGGRIDYRKRGVVAIDARQVLLKELEKKGKFEITDPELRSLATLIWEYPSPPDGFPTDRRLLEFPWTESFQEAKKMLDAHAAEVPGLPK